jgi:hypothetical protein
MAASSTVVQASPPTDTGGGHGLHAVRDNPGSHHVLINDLEPPLPITMRWQARQAMTERAGSQLGLLRRLVLPVPDPHLQGILDCQGCEIGDLCIDRPGEFAVELFGTVGEERVINNAGLAAANVTCEVTAWGPVGASAGRVSNSYSTGSLTGEMYVGDRVAYVNQGTDSNSFWDTQTSGQATSASGTGKTTVGKQDIATLTDTETEGLEDPRDMTTVIPGETNVAYTSSFVDGMIYPVLRRWLGS